MAKPKEKTGEEVVENQEPESPKKKEKKSGEIKLPLLIGIIAGSIIILVVAVRFLFLPYLVENLSAQTELNSTAGKDFAENKDAHSGKKLSSKDEEELILDDEKKLEFIETGRITTNPKMSSQFVVVNLGMIFAAKDEDALNELKESGGKEEGGGLPQNMVARIKGNVNSVLGSMSVEDLQAKRDSLPTFFKGKIKPIFKEKNLLLKEIILQEFIVQ